MGPKKIAAYLVFAGEMREPTKAELIAAGDAKPGMGDIAKRVGEKWKLLSEDEKAAYKTKAETINAENEREYAAKVASGEIVEGGEDDKDDAEPDLSLPLARVKRIMRLDKEVKNTAVDACRLVSRATELFVESLVEGAYHTMKQQKRKTVKHADVEHHVLRKPRLEFLHDHGTFFFFFNFATLATPAIVAAARGARSRRTSTDHVPELPSRTHRFTPLQTHLTSNPPASLRISLGDAPDGGAEGQGKRRGRRRRRRAQSAARRAYGRQAGDRVLRPECFRRRRRAGSAHGARRLERRAAVKDYVTTVEDYVLFRRSVRAMTSRLQ